MPTLPHSVPPTLQQATADPHFCQRLLDTRGQSGSVSCGITAPLSRVLVPKVLLVPRSLFPQSCVSSGGSMVGLMVTSSKWPYAIPRSAAPGARVEGHG